MRPELTKKQQEVLNFLEKIIIQHGTAPSLRQAATALGISHAAVAQLIRTLETKGYIRRDGRYGRSLYLLNDSGQETGVQRWREIPIIGHVQAGLPMYAQQEWNGSVVVDQDTFRGQNLFALRITGDSMKDAGILHHDMVICEPRQYAQNGEIVVALIKDEEATVKYFYLLSSHVELQPANQKYKPMRYDFSEILVQGKVIGIIRDQISEHRGKGQGNRSQEKKGA